MINDKWEGEDEDDDIAVCIAMLFFTINLW